MQLIESLSLKHILKRPLKRTEKPPLFLMIHGHGSNERDLITLTKGLPAEFFIISIRASYSIGKDSYTWYNIEISAEGIYSNNHQALNSRNRIINFINEAISTYNLDSKNVWLCGFSQGAILSYAVSLLKPHMINKVIALSGFLHQELLDEDMNKDFSSLDFFISHGKYDKIIPISQVKGGLEILKKYHICYSYKEYEEGHELNEENYKDMLKWVNYSLNPSI